MQMVPAPLVADPAGDPDREAHLEVRPRLVRGAGEAVRDGRRQVAPVLRQDPDEIRVRIALVQEQRATCLDREFDLHPERAFLRVVRTVVPEVVEAAFAGRDDLRLREQFAERRQVRRGTAALDVLEELQRGLALGRAPASLKADLDRLRRGGEMTGEPGLDAALLEIDTRLAVELAKLEMSLGVA